MAVVRYRYEHRSGYRIRLLAVADNKLKDSYVVSSNNEDDSLSMADVDSPVCSLCQDQGTVRFCVR